MFQSHSKAKVCIIVFALCLTGIMFLILGGKTSADSEGVGWVAPVSSETFAWEINCVECESVAGLHRTSMAIDSGDMTHVAYTDFVNGRNMKYGVEDGSGWTFSYIDDSGNIQLDRRFTLRLDSSDQPHIAYINNSSGLQYGTVVTTSWQLETIEVDTGARHVALALDNQDKAHIVYSLDANLWYATNESGSWVKEHLAFADDAYYPAIALDSTNRPHIAYQYCEPEINRLEELSLATPAGFCAGPKAHYTYFDGAIWQTDVIDDGWREGYDIAIILDSNDLPHVIYNEGNGSPWAFAKYAYSDGTDWHIEIIGETPNEFIYGIEGDIALDALGIVHVTFKRYTDISNRAVVYGVRLPGGWQVADVAAGEYGSLEIDASGMARFSFSHSRPDDLSDVKIAQQLFIPTDFLYLPFAISD